MPLVYIPDSVYAPSHYQPHHAPPYQQQSYHPASSPYGLPEQPQVHFGAPPPPPQPIRSAYPDQHYHQHPAAYPPQHIISHLVDPAESHKQRLLADFAQSLDQRYAASQPHHHHHHSLAAASGPFAQQARIEYLEEQLRAEKLERRKLDERAERKAAAKEAAKREREQVEVRQRVASPSSLCLMSATDTRPCTVIPQKISQLRLRYLQQQQQHQHAHDRRRVAFVADQPAAAAPARHRHVVDEDQLVAPFHAQHARSQPEPQPEPRPRPQSKQPHPSGPSVDQLTQLLALAQLLEAHQSPHPEPTAQPSRAPEVDTPTPINVAYHYIPHLSAHSPPSASAPAASAGPSSHTASSPLPPAPASSGPTPLVRLRLLQSRLNLLLSSSAVAPAAELEKLLAEADELESGGDEEVRRERRRLVRALEVELAKGETGQNEKGKEEMGGLVGDAEMAVDEAGEEREGEGKVQGYAVPDLTFAPEAEPEEVEDGVKEEKKLNKGKGRAVTVEDAPEKEQEEGYTVV